MKWNGMVRTTTKVVRVARADIQGMGVYVVDKSIRLTTDRSSDYNLCLALTETHDNRMASHQPKRQPQGAQPTSKSVPLATASSNTGCVVGWCGCEGAGCREAMDCRGSRSLGSGSVV